MGFFNEVLANYGPRPVTLLKHWCGINKKLASLRNRRIFLLECRRSALVPQFIEGGSRRYLQTVDVPEGRIAQWLADFKLSIPLETTLDGTIRYSRCFMYDKKNTTLLNERNVFLGNDNKGIPAVPCKDGWVYDDSKYKNTAVTKWNLVCENNFLPTLALILFGIGGLVGNYIFGYLQDGMGRKPSFFIYLLIQCIFGITTIFADSFTMWMILRVGVGFTVPAILGTPIILAIELVRPKFRTIVTILINISYSLALISLSIIVYYVRDWKMLSLATSLPFIAFFFYWPCLPESPRWLMSKGRFEEAEAILKKIARVNGKSYSGRLTEDQLLKKNLLTDQSGFDVNYGILDLFKTPNLRWKTIIITFIWFTNTSVYVGLSYYAPALNGDDFLNFFLAGLVELPTYIFLWPFMEKRGRKWTLCVSMIVGGTACLATYFVNDDQVITLGLYCIGKMGISSSFVVLPLMAAELYPTVVRGLGISLSSVVGMLGPVFIPLVNYLGSNMMTLPLIIMGVILLFGAFSALLLPETLNKHLPQTIEDAEKQGFASFKCFASKK